MSKLRVIIAKVAIDSFLKGYIFKSLLKVLLILTLISFESQHPFWIWGEKDEVNC